MHSTVAALVCTNRISEDLFKSIHSICIQDYEFIRLAIFFDGSIYSDLVSINKIIDNCYSMGRDVFILGSHYNIGLTQGLVALQSNVSADFFARLDVGDYWVKTKISKQISLALTYNFSIVGTKSTYIDIHSKVIGYSSSLPQDSHMIINRIKKYKGLYDHSSILFSSIYRYDKRWYYSQDMKLYVDIANDHGSFGFVDEFLTLILLNFQGITITKRPVQLYYENAARKLLGNQFSVVDEIKSIDDLSPPSSLFVHSYKRYILFAQQKNIRLALFYLVLSCLLDARVFRHYCVRAKIFFSEVFS